eukprot:jgi/Botrbrau1/7349/Bobra.247_3s0041.1
MAARDCRLLTNLSLSLHPQPLTLSPLVKHVALLHLHPRCMHVGLAVSGQKLTRCNLEQATLGHGGMATPRSHQTSPTFPSGRPSTTCAPPTRAPCSIRPLLLSTGDHDDRVAPLHSFKMIATLQHTLAGSPDSPQRNPLLLRVETRAGHGGGKPTALVIEEKADIYSFAMAVMGAPWLLQEELKPVR